MTRPEATANAPEASPWSCQPVSVPSGHEISQTSMRASPARRAQVRSSLSGSSADEVRVEGVAAGGLPQLGEGTAAARTPGWKVEAVMSGPQGRGRAQGPARGGTGTGGRSSAV